MLARIGLLCLLVPAFQPLRAQVGPVDHDGYLEYQYRLVRSEELADNTLHLATWRARASTFIWQPYILILDGTLGLTRARNDFGDARNTNSIITGSVAANAFARSRFPFRAYFESRDSRVDGDVFDTDLVTRNWGFLQQFSPRAGGRLAVDFRQSDSEDLRVDGFREGRDFSSSTWQITGTKATKRNNFNLLSSFRDLSRDQPMQMETRNLFNLRHRFRTSPRFFIEDTTFYSDEDIDFGNMQATRRFFQFNGNANWRPQTNKPLLVVGRAIAQGVDSGRMGNEAGSSSYVLSATANYQFSRNLNVAGNFIIRSADADDRPEESSVFQRLRTTYRSDAIPLGRVDYLWGGSVEVGNRRDRNEGQDTVQDVLGLFNHGLTRNTTFAGGRSLQLNLSQTLSALEDTEDRREQTLIHSAYLTWNRQNGRMSNYIRLSASDRRSSGDREDTFQLVNFQASARMQMSRKRSWNGSITFQYNNSTATMPHAEDMDNSSVTYSADLRYMERDLFNVARLDFQSELRLMSANFRSNDLIDEGIAPDRDRDDSVWRNELNYRVGLLELRMLAELRQIEDRWSTQVYFLVRRYYGIG
jgi:hypothetical protein